MKGFTLQFQGKGIEEEYQKMLYKKTSKTLQRNFTILTLVSLVWLVKNAIFSKTFNSSTLVPLCLFITFGLIGKFIEKFPKLLDYVLFIFQIGLNIFWVFCQIFDLHSGIFLLVDSYSFGLIISYFSQWYNQQIYNSYNVGSNTTLKLMTIVVNTVQIFILLTLQYQSLTFQSILLIISGGMCMYHLHSDDKCKREAYLISNQQELWEQNIDQISEIGIVQCSFNKKNNSLELNKANRISRKKFKIEDQASFKVFARNLIITVPQSDTVQKEQKIKLEQFLFYMFSDDDQQSTQFNDFKIRSRSHISPHSFYQTSGVFLKNNYKIKIFSFWRTEQIAVIQISKLGETVQLKTMELNLNICQIALQSYQTQFQKMIITTEAFLKRIDPRDQRKQISPKLQQIQNKLLTLVEYNLYESFRQNINIQLYFHPKIKLTYQVFQPAKVIQNVIQLLKYRIQEKNFEIITEQAPFQIEITSNYQMFHQLIMNLLEKIISSSKSSGKIYILYQPVQSNDELLSFNNYVQFNFLTDAISVKGLLVGENWALSPLSLGNCRQASYQQTKQLNINLCISHHIVGMLGPYNKIKYISSDSMCRISFRIYTNLKNIKTEIVEKSKDYPQMEVENNSNTGLYSPQINQSPQTMLLSDMIRHQQD